MLLMNCSTCNKMACIQCETHSYNKNGLCYPCTRLANCSDCTNDGVCTACLPLTYIDMFTVNTSCSSCDIAHCVGCVDGPLCINC